MNSNCALPFYNPLDSKDPLPGLDRSHFISGSLVHVSVSKSYISADFKSFDPFDPPHAYSFEPICAISNLPRGDVMGERRDHVLVCGL